MTDAPEPSEATRFQVEANKEIELAKIQLARDQFEYEKANSSRLTTAQIALLTSEPVRELNELLESLMI